VRTRNVGSIRVSYAPPRPLGKFPNVLVDSNDRGGRQAQNDAHDAPTLQSRRLVLTLERATERVAENFVRRHGAGRRNRRAWPEQQYGDATWCPFRPSEEEFLCYGSERCLVVSVISVSTEHTV